MSLSKKHREYVKRCKNEGRTALDFKAWSALNDRLKGAREARAASAPVIVQESNNVVDKIAAQIEALQAQLMELTAPKPVKARTTRTRTTRKAAPVTAEREIVSVPHRVDCSGMSKGLVKIAVDSRDRRKALKALDGLYVLEGEVYTSSIRGERVTMFCQPAQISKVVKALHTAGLTPAGKRNWKRVGVTL